MCTRFDGGARARRHVAALSGGHVLVPVCPEQLGGLSTPRPPAEIEDGDGRDVLDGCAAVLTREGMDVTAAFVRGAGEVVRAGRVTGATTAVVKARSPSCGVHETYDGSFSGTLRHGPGVTSALLEREGFAVLSDEDVAEGRISLLE